MNADAKLPKRGSREAILDAAEALVREQGVNRMTLDAVAARAGLSKGGLLYNFPSKDALLLGLIERFTERMEMADGDGSPGRVVTRRLAVHDESVANRRGGLGMLAAFAENPDLIEPVRAFRRQLWEHWKATEADPERGLIAWLAAEGLCFLDLFETSPLTPEEHGRVVAAIERIARGER